MLVVLTLVLGVDGFDCIDDTRPLCFQILAHSGRHGNLIEVLGQAVIDFHQLFPFGFRLLAH